MRLSFKFALAVLPLCFAVAASAAQSESQLKTGIDYGDTVLVSAEQGQAVADFVMQSGPRVSPKPDCSHLVHLLYARAGLIYPYEDSRVLYRGIDDFERVKKPQPGDLAVWLGHVGIVLSPEEKTFLSSVRSGIITESWTAPHWARRGHPHFFRYRIGPSANLELLAAIMSDGSAVSNAGVRNPAVRMKARRLPTFRPHPLGMTTFKMRTLQVKTPARRAHLVICLCRAMSAVMLLKSPSPPAPLRSLP
ncbi:MAG TPA: NlpC/P60 family protein [Alphaproteobacteria bacterium]|nr:NlpC/P60 family protein [Alphaproteobacteria bacterium]